MDAPGYSGGVPEICNEIPSDQELTTYLNESLKSSSIALLDDYPDNQHHYHPDIVEALAYLSSRPISAEFLSVLKGSMFLSLQHLNRLPRNDPFWRNTNFRPTVPKLREFCEKVLSGDPHDVTSLLTITAMIIFHTGEFQRGRWIELLALNAVSVLWVVFAAMFMEACGADDSDQFAEFVNSSGMQSAITPLLKEIARSGGKLLSQWSDSVIALLASE